MTKHEFMQASCLIGSQKRLHGQRHWFMSSMWSERLFPISVEAGKGRDQSTEQASQNMYYLLQFLVKIGPVSMWFTGRVTQSELLTLLLETVALWSVVWGSLCKPGLQLNTSPSQVKWHLQLTISKQVLPLGLPWAQAFWRAVLESTEWRGREQWSAAWFCGWSAAPSGNIQRKWQVEISPYWFYFHNICKTILTKDVFQISLWQKI